MSGTDGPGSVFRVLEARVANPVLRVLLRTPAARLFGERLVLLSYRGRRSGRRIRTPVMAIPDGDDRVVTTYRSGVKWWRNFQSAHDATLWVTGEPVPVTGEATLDERAVASWLGTLQERDQGRVLQFFGLPADADDAALESAAGEVVVVRFTPRAAGAGPTDSSPSGG